MARNPIELKVVEDYGPGRGGIVTIPIARLTEDVVLENSSSGGSGTFDFDSDLFEQVARNLHDANGPIPVYPGHIPREDRRTTPAWGDVRNVWIEGDMLMATVALTPKGWKMIVDEAGFYGASVELDLNPPVATGNIDGWMLTGLAITNSPLLDVFYSVAFSANEGRKHLRMSLGRPAHKEVVKMSGPTVETLQAENSRISAELKAAKEENEKMKKDLETRPTREEFMNLSARLEAQNLDNLKVRVTSICDNAVNQGVAPAVLEGYKDDPVDFLKKFFGGSIEALEVTVARLPRQRSNAEVGSGSSSNQEPTGTPIATFQAEVKKIAAERNVTQAEAYEIVRQANPQLFKQAFEASLKLQKTR